MKVEAGIGDQYLYRSLFSLQLFHCLKYIPRRQVLVIENEDLRLNGEDVMARIHEFIGVPSHTYPSMEKEAIKEHLNIKYPDFEKRTGWRLDSEYEEQLPENLVQELKMFMKPHMDMLARLLGQDLGDWAVDSANGGHAMGEGTWGSKLGGG
ncbi:unnamed protein product [Choristocarpus tenellus]